jgi:type 1 glutamine amidotransferase
MNRREFLLKTGTAAAALGLARMSFPLGWVAAADKPRKKILMYTRSVGFQHPVVTRKDGKLSLAETIVTDLGKQHGFDVVCEKDGRVFLSKEFPSFDGFFFETQGNLSSERSLDGSPPMTPDGKKALLDAVASGKGFGGCHCASDTFHSPGRGTENQAPDKIDPYIAMVGGEFIVHGAQQKAHMRVIDHEFPGARDLKDFELLEEWYALKNFAPDLHVILAQDSEGMQGIMYHRAPFPATWARKHHKGRVFYTSMGHREDVWENKVFQQLLLGGLSWALGNVEADVTPNLKTATPKASDLPRQG